GDTSQGVLEALALEGQVCVVRGISEVERGEILPGAGDLLPAQGTLHGPIEVVRSGSSVDVLGVGAVEERLEDRGVGRGVIRGARANADLGKRVGPAVLALELPPRARGVH